MNEKELTNILKTITHEINTPIGMVSMTAQVVKAMFKNNEIDKDKVLEYMDNIISNCNKISSFTYNFKELLGYANCRIEYVDTKAFFDAFCKAMEFYIKSDDVEFKGIYKTDKEFIGLPIAVIERILSNLITNAVKYNDKKIKKVTFKMTNDDKNIIFSVKDNGIGISKKNIPRLKEQFFRVDNNFRSGMGIGLTLVDAYLKAANGNMSVKSKLNVGTEFVVEIPFKSEKELYTMHETDYVYKPNTDLIKADFHNIY